MKRFTAIPLILLLAVGASTLALAEGYGDAAKAHVETTKGTVSAVDSSAVTVDVPQDSGKTEAMTFKLDSKTKVIKDGATMSVKDIAKGAEITVTYMKKDDGNVAVAIGIV